MEVSQFNKQLPISHTETSPLFELKKKLEMIYIGCKAKHCKGCWI